MAITSRPYTENDLPIMTDIWNEVVAEGLALFHDEPFSLDQAREFFASQTCCGVTVNGANKVLGLYIVFTKNVGRGSHICGISYALTKASRDIGVEKPLMMDAMLQARKKGFKIIEVFAAKTNYRDRNLYERLGFFQLGVIKRGYRSLSGKCIDLCPYWRNI